MITHCGREIEGLVTHICSARTLCLRLTSINHWYFWPMNWFRIGNSNLLLRVHANILMKVISPFWWQQPLPGGMEQWLLKIMNAQGLPFLKIITCLTSRILKFFDLLIWNKEEKFVQIHLPDLKFYLPRAVRQWEMRALMLPWWK